MKAVFENLNNNDYEHDIIILCLEIYSSGFEIVTVLFDGYYYRGRVNIDEKGRRSFKRLGKEYAFEIVMV